MRKHTRPEPAPRAVSADHAAVMLGVSRRTVYNLMADGSLDSRKLGRRRVIPVEAIDALLNAAHPV